MRRRSTYLVLFVLAVVAASLAVGVARASALSYTPPAYYATGGESISVAAADFNGDGVKDLATANAYFNTVSVLIGNGDGTFAATTDFATGSVPISIAAGDFNGDGKRDLVTSNEEDYTVSILLGKGDGAFQAHADYATGAYPESVAVGDFNGDGKQDLATANRITDTVSVLLGNGDGSFAAKTDFATGTYPASVAVGDFNGDGRPDLATADYRSAADTVSILLNDGTGAFPSHVEYATGSGPFALAVGDLDGDGKLDLVAADVGGAFATDRSGQRRIYRPFDAGVGGVSVLLGNGNGTFQGKTDYPAGLASSVAIGDFNGDSKPDLATANPYNYGVAVLLYTQLPKGTMTIDEGAAATKVRLVRIDSAASYAVAMRLRDAGGTWSAWQPYAAQTSWTLPAGDGAKSVDVQYRNSDGDSAVVSASILLDTVGPRTQGAKVVAHRSKRVTFRIRIKDAKPGSPTTSTDPAMPVTIKIRNLRGVLLRTITATAPFATNVQVKLTWKKCDLRAGHYTFKVCACDLAGNWSARTQFNTLIVK